MKANESIKEFLNTFPLLKGNPHTEKESVKRWEDMGFLQGLSSKDKKNVAKHFDNLNAYLLKQDREYSFEYTVLHPAIRRILAHHEEPMKEIDVEHFTNWIDTYYKDVEKLAKAFNRNTPPENRDIEAETCALICELYQFAQYAYKAD